jgi:hypothetical protein
MTEKTYFSTGEVVFMGSLPKRARQFSCKRQKFGKTPSQGTSIVNFFSPLLTNIRKRSKIVSDIQIPLLKGRESP